MYTMDQTVHINPTKEDRKPTNVGFVVVISLILLIWLGVTIKVMASDSLRELHDTVEEVSRDIIDESKSNAKPFDEDKSEDNKYKVSIKAIGGITLKFTWPFLICTVVSAVIAYFYTYFLSLPQSKFIVVIAMYLLCIAVVALTVFNIVLSLLLAEYVMVHAGFIFVLMYTPYLIICFRCARNVGSQAIFEVIKDSSRSVTSCLTIPLFICVMAVIISIISSVTVYILYCIGRSSFDLFDIQTAYFILETFCGKALINFLVNFSHIVISGCVIDYYWMKDQQSITPDTFKRSITRTLRYHMGTVAFSSIPFLSYLLSIIQACRHKDSDPNAIKIYNIFTRFFSQVCVTIHIVDFALIQTSINGSDYLTAIMAAHDLVARNNHELNMAVTEVSFMVAVIGYFFMALPFGCERIQSFMYSVIIPFSILFSTAVHALLVNKMIIDHTSEALQESHKCNQIEIGAVEPSAEPLIEMDTQTSV